MGEPIKDWDGNCTNPGWVDPALTPELNPAELADDLPSPVVLFAADAYPPLPSKADQRRLEKALGTQGVALNEQAMVALQTRALIRLFVGDDPARQLAYDIAYQEAVAEGLGEVEVDLRRRKLTGGLVLPGVNGQIR